MSADWLILSQGAKAVDEYEMEFSHLLRFAGEGYRKNERMKVQKFQNGLNPEIKHEVRMFELDTLAAVMHKAKLVEKSKNDCNTQQAKNTLTLGKRTTFTSPSARSFGQGSGFKGKKPMTSKQPTPSSNGKGTSKVDEPVCGVCFCPHDVSTCKWTPGACFSCGRVGHKSIECKDPILKPVFCYHCKQRSHYAA